jgi:hypothetical protein
MKAQHASLFGTGEIDRLVNLLAKDVVLHSDGRGEAIAVPNLVRVQTRPGLVNYLDREKGGSAVGKTRRGKGTKFIVAVDGRGVPISVQLASAQIAECRLAGESCSQSRRPPSTII